MKIYFGMRSTRDIIMRHGVLTAGATWATDQSVSLTSLPYPGVGDPKWGLLRACVLGLKYY